MIYILQAFAVGIFMICIFIGLGVFFYISEHGILCLRKKKQNELVN
jgi:hypothetical protein